MKKIILSIAAFCIFNNAEAQLTSLTVGSVAPDFTLTDLDGVAHTKASFAGKYVLVDMFFYNLWTLSKRFTNHQSILHQIWL